MAMSQKDWSKIYSDNKELWADLTPREAQFNYVRAQTGNVDSARLLMEFSMVPSVKYGSGSEVAQASTKGNVQRVKELLDLPTSLTVVNAPREDGTTPLIAASMMGHAHVVKLLLEEDSIDVEAKGANGATALHVAASMGHTEVFLQASLAHICVFLHASVDN